MSDRIDVSATVTVNDQATGPIGQIRGALQGVQAQARQIGASFRSMGTVANLGGAVRGLGSAFGRLGNMVMSVVKPVAALVGIGGAIGIAEAIEGMEHYVSTAKELSRMAPVLGTTVERLSELQFAASKAGIGADELNNAMLRANTAIGKAATGKGTDLTKVLDAMKISMRDANGQIRTSADLMPEFADAIMRQTDPVLQLRLATEMFGRAAGPEMLKMLLQGSQGIQNYIDQARELGLVISEEKAAEAMQFAKAQGAVRNVWASLSRELSQNLLPILYPLITMFAELLRENKEAIVRGMTSAFNALADALKAVDWKATIEDIKDWGRWIKDNIKYIGGFKGALAILALLMAGPLIAALVSVGAAFVKLGVTLAALAFANPVIAAILVAVAALAYAGYQIYQNWDNLGAWFAGLWQQVKDAFAGFNDWLGSWGNLFLPIVIYRNWEEITGWFSGLWERVKDPFNAIVDWLGPWGNLFIPIAIYKNWDGIKEFFSRLWSGDVQGAFDGAVAWLGPWGNLFLPVAVYNNWAGVKEFFSRLWSGDVKGAFDGAITWLGPWANLFLPVGIYNNWEPIKQWFVDLWDDPKATFQRAVEWLTDFVGRFIPQPVLDAWGTVRQFFATLWDNVTQIFRNAWAIIEPIVEALKNAISWITGNMPSISSIGEGLKSAGSAVFNAPGRLLDYGRESVANLIGGGSQASVVQQQAAAQPARVDGEVGVNIHMTGAPPGTTIETQERGQVRATGDVGMSMATP